MSRGCDLCKVFSKKASRLSFSFKYFCTFIYLRLPKMSYNVLIVIAIALIGITAGSYCLSLWVKNPESADFKLKAYAIFNATVGTTSLTYVMIHVFRALLN